jgi:hypothetical protein
MSDAAASHHAAGHGLSLLPPDLTEHQLIAAPALASVDELLIDELTDDEDDAFATALATDA